MKFNHLGGRGGQNGLTGGTRVSMSVVLLLYFSLLVSAQPGTPPGSNNNDTSSDPYYTNAKFSPAMGVLLIVLVSVLFLMGFFSIYIRSCAGAGSASTSRAPGPIQRMMTSRRGPRGLDQAVIQSFPTFGYSQVKTLRIGKATLECAVCLNEFEDDETLRLIPKCDHVFHPECIDQWLGSHTTCPVCRADLKPGDDLPQISESDNLSRAGSDEIRDAVVIDLGQPPVVAAALRTSSWNNTTSSSSSRRVVDRESMERPLTAASPGPCESNNSNNNNNNTSGRPRWLGMFTRSNSTGHVAVRQWEDVERFTLRIPEAVRKQIISGKLNRTTSCVALPRESSSRRGYRGSYRELGGRRTTTTTTTNAATNRVGRSGRWLMSLTSSFLSRSPSVRSPRVAADGGDGSVRLNPNHHRAGAGSSRVDPALPQV